MQISAVTLIKYLMVLPPAPPLALSRLSYEEEAERTRLSSSAGRKPKTRSIRFEMLVEVFR